MSQKRLTPDERRKVIVAGAVAVHCRSDSLYEWTRKDVAAACEIQTSPETVKKYFPTMPVLRDAVLKAIS